MASQRFRFPALISLCLAAISWVAILPQRAISLAVDFIDAFVLTTDPRAVSDLLAGGHQPFAYAGPSGDQVSAALAHEQRHEAGLARLGAVRHR